MTPPTGLQNNRPGTAAAAADACVVKHEASANGRRVSKQTGPGRRDRCSHSESGLARYWPRVLHTAADTAADGSEDPPREADCWGTAATQIKNWVLYH